MGLFFDFEWKYIGKIYSKMCFDGGREIGLDMIFIFFFIIVIFIYMNVIVILIRVIGFFVMNYKVIYMNCMM